MNNAARVCILARKNERTVVERPAIDRNFIFITAASDTQWYQVLLISLGKTSRRVNFLGKTTLLWCLLIHILIISWVHLDDVLLRHLLSKKPRKLDAKQIFYFKACCCREKNSE